MDPVGPGYWGPAFCTVSLTVQREAALPLEQGCGGRGEEGKHVPSVQLSGHLFSTHLSSGLNGDCESLPRQDHQWGSEASADALSLLWEDGLPTGYCPEESQVVSHELRGSGQPSVLHRVALLSVGFSFQASLQPSPRNASPALFF